MLPFFGSQVREFVEIRDFNGNLDLETGGIETGDPPDTAFSQFGSRPKVLAANAIWTHRADSGNHHTVHHFAFVYWSV
jgi:hypothetical protein